MEQILTEKQLIMMKTAYEFSKQTPVKVLMLGSFPTTKEGREFLKPFIKTGMIHESTLIINAVTRAGIMDKNNIIVVK